MSAPGRDGPPWRRLRALEPGPGSRERVLGAVQSEIRHSRGLSRAAVVAVPAALLATVALVWLATAPASPIDSPAAAGDTAAVAPRDAGVDAATVAVRALEHIEVALADAAVTVSGPAAVRLGDGELTLDQGRVQVRGEATVQCPRCRARVSGAAEVVVAGERAQVRVFAGSVEIDDESHCELIGVAELDPAPPQPATAGEPASNLASARRARRAARPDVARGPVEASPAPASEPAALRAQVEAFRAAAARRGTDDGAALRGWLALRARWPDTPLREEVDAAIVLALRDLGRDAEARREARAFVARHPHSRRAPHMTALAAGELR